MESYVGGFIGNNITALMIILGIHNGTFQFQR